MIREDRRRQKLFDQLGRIEQVYPGSAHTGDSPRARATRGALRNYILNCNQNEMPVSDAILKNLLSITATYPGVQFRVTIFAWGHRFVGTMVPPGDYGGALIEALDLTFTSSPAVYADVRNALLESIFELDEANSGDIYLSDAIADGVPLEGPIRIPESTVQGYVFHGRVPRAETKFKAVDSSSLGGN